MNCKVAKGGPERKSFRKDNVVPVSFSEKDPFYDLAAVLDQLDDGCRSGKVTDFVIIQRDIDGVGYTWRGEGRLSTILGAMEYAKDMMLDSTRR